MAPDGWECWVGEGRGAQWSDGAKTLGPTTRGEYAPTQRRMHQRADACAGSKQTAPNMSPRLRRPSARTPRPNMSFNQSAHASIRRGRRPEPPPAIEKQSSTRLPRECKTRPWPCPARNAPRARNVANIQISAKTNRRQMVSHMMATSANICPLCIPRAASMSSRSHYDTKSKTKRSPTNFRQLPKPGMVDMSSVSFCRACFFPARRNASGHGGLGAEKNASSVENMLLHKHKATKRMLILLRAVSCNAKFSVVASPPRPDCAPDHGAQPKRTPKPKEKQPDAK